MAARITATQMAVEALGRIANAEERIATHEKECGERWLETLLELKSLRVATDDHSARWEKLAWLVIASLMATVGAYWSSVLF
jgi:hypothetical protein|tara:strand:- start:267 stop:512 length:246 start_codon:yes stop_codon:yes gene_type:complete